MRGKLAVISPFNFIRFSDAHILQAIISPKSAWNTPIGGDCSIVQRPLEDLTVIRFSNGVKNVLAVVFWPQVQRMCLKFTMNISPAHGKPIYGQEANPSRR
jgi:hypothetical protein